MDEISVYITALCDSLKKKSEILKEIYDITGLQSELLKDSKLDIDKFDLYVNQKTVLIDEIKNIDKGFNALYAKIGNTIKNNQEHYKEIILQMQNLIRVIMDYGLKLKALESSNKEKFEAYLKDSKKEIKDFKVNNKTAVSYYQNMANQHREWQSYFMDQKK